MHLRPLAAAFVLLGAGFPALAQDVRTDSDTLNSLLACRAIGDDAARLACQDEQLDALAQAFSTFIIGMPSNPMSRSAISPGTRCWPSSKPCVVLEK